MKYNTLLMKTCEYICINQVSSSNNNNSSSNSSSSDNNKEVNPFEDVLVAFLKAGADPNITDYKMNSAISIAIHYQCSNIVELLLTNTYSPVNAHTNPGLASKILEDYFDTIDTIDTGSSSTNSSSSSSSGSSSNNGSANNSNTNGDMDIVWCYLDMLLKRDTGWCNVNGAGAGAGAGTRVGAKHRKIKVKYCGLLQTAAKCGFYSIVEKLLLYNPTGTPTGTQTSPTGTPKPSTLGLQLLHHVDDHRRSALEVAEAAYLANHLEILKRYVGGCVYIYVYMVGCVYIWCT